jgi:hypothetical protein
MLESQLWRTYSGQRPLSRSQDSPSEQLRKKKEKKKKKCTLSNKPESHIVDIITHFRLCFPKLLAHIAKYVLQRIKYNGQSQILTM